MPSGDPISPLSMEEINSAKAEILKYVQRQSYTKEISSLKETERHDEKESPCDRSRETTSVKKSSSVYKLDPVLVDGVLRVGGRLKLALIHDEPKNPAILPKQHHVVDLIVSYYHARSGHSGLEHVLSMIRERFV